MVTQEIVKYQTANLANKKGFKKHCSFYYELEGGECFLNTVHNRIDLIPDHYIPAPSQVQLQKWLRDEHNIEVYVTVNFYNRKEKLGYLYNIDKFDAKNIHDGQTYDNEQIQLIGEFQGFITFEQALEVGLFKALNLITKC